MKTHKILISLCLLVLFGFNAFGQNPPADANAPRAARPVMMERMALGEPNLIGSLSVEEVISHQKRTTGFSTLPLDESQLRQLAWAAQSIIDTLEKQAAAENVMLSMNIYFCMQTGVYHYNAANNSLENISPVDARNTIAGAARNQTAIQDAPCTIVITGSIPSGGTITREQARNAIMLSAGKIAQNIELQAQSIGLGTLGTGNFDLSRVKRVTKLPQQQDAAYIVTAGWPEGFVPSRRTPPGQMQVLIITPGSERSDDVFTIKDVLTSAKIKPVIAQVGSNRIRIEKWQRIIQPDIAIQDVVVNDYNGVIIIGGVGDPTFLRNPTLLSIVQTAVRQGKVVGAAGDAGQVLANAGVLGGVLVAGDQRMLMNSGATITGNLVESDQGIVTSLNQQAGYFARTFVATLKGRPLQQQPPPTQAIPPTAPPPMRTRNY